MKRGLFAAGSLLWTIAGPAGAVGNLVDVTVYDRMENRTLPVYRHPLRHLQQPGGDGRDPGAADRDAVSGTVRSGSQVTRS